MDTDAEVRVGTTKSTACDNSPMKLRLLYLTSPPSSNSTPCKSKQLSNPPNILLKFINKTCIFLDLGFRI